MLLTGACSRQEKEKAATSNAPTEQASPAESPQVDQQVPTLLAKTVRERWTGDLDVMIERRYIRALVTFNRTFYFYDGVEARGISQEAFQEFEKVLNQKLQTGMQEVQVILIPVRKILVQRLKVSDKYLPALA